MRTHRWNVVKAQECVVYHLLELPVIIGLQVGRARVHHVDEAVGACRTLGVKRQQNKNVSRNPARCARLVAAAGLPEGRNVSATARYRRRRCKNRSATPVPARCGSQPRVMNWRLLASTEVTTA